MDVLVVLEDALLAEQVDFSLTNLLAEDLLADLCQFVGRQPCRQVIHVIFQDYVIDFIIAACLEELAELWHPSGAAIRKDLIAHKLFINVSIILFAFLS